MGSEVALFVVGALCVMELIGLVALALHVGSLRDRLETVEAAATKIARLLEPDRDAPVNAVSPREDWRDRTL